MYCPPGYFDWQDIRRMADNWAERFYVANALHTYSEATDTAFSDEFRIYADAQALNRFPSAVENLRLRDRDFEIQIISFWLVNAICERFDPLLCTKEGNLLRAWESIFLHPDQFYCFPLDFPLRSMTELHRIYEEYDAKRMTSNDLWDRFSCIDANTGLVRQKVQTKNNFERWGGGAEEYSEFVEPFVGCSVVFSPDSFPESLEELVSEFDLPSNWLPKNDRAINELEVRRRGAKPAPAKAEFLRRYPEGIPGGLSADAVAAELCEAGFPVTGRTVLNYNKYRRISK